MCNSKLVIWRLWLSRALSWSSSCICCNSRNFGLWRSEKAAEIWITGEAHRESVQGSSAVQPALCVLLCTFYITSQQSLLSVRVLGLPLHHLFCAKLFQQCLPQGLSHLCIWPSAAAAVCSSLMALHQLFHTSIHPRQWPHTLKFVLTASFLLEALLFSRNKDEGGIFISFFPSFGVWSAMLSISSP